MIIRIIVFVAGVVILIAFFASSKEKAPAVIATTPAYQEKAINFTRYALEDMRIISTTKGKEYLRSGEKSIIHSATITQDGYHIVADTVEQTKMGDTVLSGNVHISTEKGVEHHFQTEELILNNQSTMLISHTPVQYFRNSDTIVAEGIVIDDTHHTIDYVGNTTVTNTAYNMQTQDLHIDNATEHYKSNNWTVITSADTVLRVESNSIDYDEKAQQLSLKGAVYAHYD